MVNLLTAPFATTAIGPVDMAAQRVHANPFTTAGFAGVADLPVAQCVAEAEPHSPVLGRQPLRASVYLATRDMRELAAERGATGLAPLDLDEVRSRWE